MNPMSSTILSKLITRGITPEHPGFAAAATREAQLREDRRREDRVRAVWGWISPRCPVPEPDGRGIILLGRWPADKFRLLARNLPGLVDLVDRHSDRIELYWTQGEGSIVMICVGDRGSRESRYRL